VGVGLCCLFEQQFATLADNGFRWRKQMSDENRRVLASGRRDQQVQVLQGQVRTWPYGGVLVPPGPPPAAPPPPSGAGVTSQWPNPGMPAYGAPSSTQDVRTVPMMRAPALPPGQAPPPSGRAAPLPPPRQAAMPAPAAHAPRSVAAPCRPSQLTPPPMSRGPAVPASRGPAVPGRAAQPTPRVQAAPDARARQVHRRSEVMEALRAEIARLNREGGR
jgi:hypothetical protein